MPLMRRAARLGLEIPYRSLRRRRLEADGPAERNVTILLSNDDRLAALNGQFRKKAYATNVLSFQARAESPYMGDIAIAYGVTAREAKEQGKSFAQHAAHLTLHGVLHLLGYDHEWPREAKEMERLETELLARLAIPDPYAFRDKAA